MGMAGVNPPKTTLGGSPLWWEHPKVHWGGPGGGPGAPEGGSGFGGTPLYPLRGCRSTLTLSPVLSIPTVGKSPPGGTPTSLRPTTVPLRVKNTWGGTKRGGVTPKFGGRGRETPPPKKTRVKRGVREGKRSQEG